MAGDKNSNSGYLNHLVEKAEKIPPTLSDLGRAIINILPHVAGSGKFNYSFWLRQMVIHSNILWAKFLQMRNKYLTVVT